MNDREQVPRTDPESPRPSGNAGFSVVGLIVAMAVMAVTACGFTIALVQAMATNAMNKETANARQAARRVLERIQGVPLADVYGTFRDTTVIGLNLGRVSVDPELDPYTGEPQTPVEGENLPDGGLEVIPSSTTYNLDGVSARIQFPGEPGSPVLLENVFDPDLGMPRDLNGDGAIDGEDHSGDYVILPVRIRVRWSGVRGERTFDMCTVLAGT